MATIELTGWELVHEWHESHGNGGQRFYQEAIKAEPQWWRPLAESRGKTPCLVVAYDRTGASTRVWMEQKGYALAAWVAANRKAEPYRWTAKGSDIAPCCTAGTDHLVLDGHRSLSIFSAAGHGAEAAYLGEVE